ncbi:hypothetical protein [Bradyrhizobium liaoningense]|uniref:hypothetical protein n=1 Tax=Bradyrhizobium liaoningense TaxID=43992 RepID=UPI001BABC8AA|nr:hypothetical protein [Bradyrhizobium liaoningense]MBR0713553.1 hypothetical protein [Bradyrhizobium liaoningense]
MNALADHALLGLWERGAGCGPVARALLLLGAAMPESSAERCAEIAIGARDAAILQLRRATFGNTLVGCANCPGCGEEHEFDLDVERLLAGTPPREHGEIVLASGLRFRLPNSGDLAAVARHNDVDAAVRQLLQRCCLNAPSGIDWSQSLLDEVESGMAAVETKADIELRFDCVACGQVWHDRLDVAGWVWEEIAARAGRLLDEVHALAMSYGWSEQQILAMSDARRDAYLQRCFT